MNPNQPASSSGSESKMKVTLLIPTVNEIEGMKAVMPRIKREWVDEIVVIDGGSTDGTYEYAKEQGYIAIRQQTQGLTASYFEAMKYVTGDIVVTFSPDGNSIPELIPPLVAKMKEGYDMVIVSRYAKGAKSEDDDPVTAFGNWMFTTLINILFGGHYTDSLVMFRAWRRKVIEACKIDAKRGGPDPHFSIICAKRKMKVADIPGDEPKRIGGVRKMSILKNGWGLVVLILKEFFTP